MSTVHVRVQIGAENYALPVIMVREVGNLGEVALVPGAPAGVLGVYNLHGQIVPVLDLGAVLGRPGGAQPEKIVVAEHAGCLAALAVDAITGVEAIADASEDVQSPHLSGAALIDGALVGVIDLQAVFESVQGHRAA